jgi:plastocyanin
MLTGRKLGLTLAFTVLVALAFGAGCQGFFPPDVLETVQIQPPSLNLGVNAQQQFTAYGTDEEGNRTLISSGLVWTSSSPSVTITNGGLATGVSVTTAAVTITGSSEGLSGTATVTVIGDVTSMTVSPTSASIEVGTTVTFTFAASPGPPDFVTTGNGGTLTITPSDNIFTCSVGVDADNNPTESCTLSTTTGASPSYTLQMSYPNVSGTGTVNSPTATVTVQ